VYICPEPLNNFADLKKIPYESQARLGTRYHRRFGGKHYFFLHIGSVNQLKHAEASMFACATY
jgi:hypothetical protein